VSINRNKAASVMFTVNSGRLVTLAKEGLHKLANCGRVGFSGLA
jgi:hypothetical protein